jgi:hypothetical protein
MARSVENCMSDNLDRAGNQRILERCTRSNRIIDLARRDAAPGGNVSVWSRLLTHRRSARSSVIEAQRLQRSFGEGLIAVAVLEREVRANPVYGKFFTS